MNVRKIKLINADGAEWDLMRRDSFAFEPSGFGISKDNEYLATGSAYALIEDLSAQKQITFTMIFSSYEVYREFALFVVKTPLKLAYMPIDKWAYIDGMITNLNKSEISHKTSRLECDGTFTATSKWYIPDVAKRTSEEVENPKRYIYSYDYQYMDAANGVIQIVNDSSEASPASIHIMGAITNPVWSLIVNEQVIESGALTANIEAGHKVVINSKDGDLEVAEYMTNDGSYVRNLYQYTDFTKETFILFPPGTSKLVVSGEASSTIEAWVELQEIYETI